MRHAFTICLLWLAVGMLYTPQSFPQEPEKQKKEEKKDKKKGDSKEENKNEKKASFTILHIEVIDAESSDPIAGATVFVQSENEGSDFQSEPRTDKNGKVKIQGVPRGKAFVQVTADSWKTNGVEHYELSRDEQTLKIKLKKQG